MYYTVTRYVGTFNKATFKIHTKVGDYFTTLDKLCSTLVS